MMNCPKKYHQERIFSERHGKAQKILLVSGGVGFCLFPLPQETTNLVQGGKEWAQGKTPRSRRERLEHTTYSMDTHAHTCTYTDMLC